LLDFVPSVPREFETRYRVAWVDTDAAGVVHFSNFFRMFERAEEDFYAKLGFDFRDVGERYNIWLPRVEAFCKYRSPAFFGDLLSIKIRLIELKEKAIRYGFRILRGEEVLAEGYVVIVAADKEKNKAAPIPREIREKLVEYFGEE